MIVFADVTDGKLDLLAGIRFQVIEVFFPPCHVCCLIVSSIQTNEVCCRGIIHLGSDIHHELFRELVGSFSHESEEVLISYSDSGGDEPVVIGKTAACACESHVLLSAIRAQDRIVVPPDGVNSQRVDDLGILQHATVGVASYERSGSFHVAVDTRPFAKVDGKGIITLEIIVESWSFRVP